MDEGKERKRAAAARTHLDVAGRTIALARPRDDGARRRRFENLAGRLRFVPLPALLLLSYHASSSSSAARGRERRRVPCARHAAAIINGGGSGSVAGVASGVRRAI